MLSLNLESTSGTSISDRSATPNKAYMLQYPKIQTLYRCVHLMHALEDLSSAMCK